MSTVPNVKELYGIEHCNELLAARVFKDNYLLKVPDGIYDHPEFFMRLVIINGQQLFKYSAEWLERGTPEGTPKEVSEPPFGYYSDYRSLLPSKVK